MRVAPVERDIAPRNFYRELMSVWLLSSEVVACVESEADRHEARAQTAGSGSAGRLTCGLGRRRSRDESPILTAEFFDIDVASRRCRGVKEKLKHRSGYDRGGSL